MQDIREGLVDLTGDPQMVIPMIVGVMVEDQGVTDPVGVETILVVIILDLEEVVEVLLEIPLEEMVQEGGIIVRLEMISWLNIMLLVIETVS